ncbi:DUF3168 domain-containing protein [Rhizobium sp. PAMB 3182]
MSAANALLQAVHAALAADAVLAGLVGPDAIHDRQLTGKARPYLVIGEMVSRDNSTSTEAGEVHLMTIEAWSDEPGRREVDAIAGAVRSVLHDAALALSGATLVSLLHQSTRVRREPKGRAFKAEITFRAVTE